MSECFTSPRFKSHVQNISVLLNLLRDYQVMLFHKCILYFLLVQIQQYTFHQGQFVILTVWLQLRMLRFSLLLGFLQ